VRALEIDEPWLIGASSGEPIDAEILVWNGRIGMLAALIGESDLYIGYDSAGQHIAAALGVNCIDVFAGFGSRRFVERWTPAGRATSRIVAVDAYHSAPDVKEMIVTVHRHAKEMSERTQ
jgi:ADP-heptose:LPS heptosyltransferase